MKLGICCNFTYPSIGGSEMVCKSIAERMANVYGMDVTVFGYNVRNDILHNKVIYQKCLKGDNFLKQINCFDHLFIYSDSFWGFETILKNIEKIKPKISIALLGMYAMLEKPELFKLFQEKKDLFRVITHSDNYQDYIKCFDNNIPVQVIPNGVNLENFSSSNIDIRKKYNIVTKYIVLNVSNYFYGKGQEYLADISKKLFKIRSLNDFTIIQLSNVVKYPYDEIFWKKANQKFCNSGIKSKFLRNLPREDVCAFFQQSDITLLTSLKEVAPIVILESMASQTPWVSMDVGNASELSGGTVLCNKDIDNKGYKIISKDTICGFADLLNMYINNKEMRLRDGYNGELMVKMNYNWDLICEKYYDIFKA